ncbi:MAG: ABC transporter permease [Alphaproteobacteria bacterium]|nr:ABC transporter permease [Alphaproteobacteria bacterium]
MNAAAWILRRLTHAAGLLLAVLVLNFLLIHLAPGDPAMVIAGEMGGASLEVMAKIRAEYGLDQPLPVQLLRYLGRVLMGDLGHSFYFNRPVAALVAERMGPTALLVVSAILVALVLGTWLGILAARRPRGVAAQMVAVFSVAGFSAPVFWTGMMLLLLFASALPIFPVSGMSDIGRPKQGFAHVLDVAHHLVLPAMTLAMVYMAQYSRQARAGMLAALAADYIRTARAKGLGERRVVYRHALRNALIPVITIAGLQFGQVLAGAVLVETVFAWPGLGRLAYESILRRDSPTLLGILLGSALLVILANLLTDAAYRLADPRMRGI